MSPKVARVVAYGGSWAVMMFLARVLGLWAIPIGLVIMAAVWIISDRIVAREAAALTRLLQRPQRQEPPRTLDPEE
jgi:hypothetical protein